MRSNARPDANPRREFPGTGPAMPKYPVWLEDWWVARACGHLHAEDVGAALRRLEAPIQALSDLFTTKRPTRYFDYTRDTESLLAYGLFFFPQTFARVQFPIREVMKHRGQPAHRGTNYRILDLGAGLGAAGFSATWLVRELLGIDRCELTLVDYSNRALTTAGNLFDDLSEHFEQVSLTLIRKDIRSVQRFLAKNAAGFDLVVISFAWNEAFPSTSVRELRRWLWELCQSLNEGGIVFIIEPAFEETAQRLERLRDLLAGDRRLHVWAPCLHHKSCPLLAEGKFWCHEVRKWSPPPSLAFLNRRLYRAIDTLKYCFLALSNQPPNMGQETPNHFRLVSPFAARKGSFLAAGCAADGRKNTYDLQTRGLAKADRDRMEELERGDVLNTDDLIPQQKRGHYRIPFPESIRKL